MLERLGSLELSIWAPEPNSEVCERIAAVMWKFTTLKTLKILVWRESDVDLLFQALNEIKELKGNHMIE